MEDGVPTRSCGASALCGRTSLLVIMTGYAIFGAFVFKTLEGGDVESDAVVEVQKSRDDCLKELWLITERLNVLYERNWTKLVTEQLKRFEKAVIDNRHDSVKPPNNTKWTYGNALLYSITILTTVGYGTVSPKTAMGKIATVVYALFGVPLMLILLSELGSFFAYGAGKAYMKVLCKQNKDEIKQPSVGYHRAPSSPSTKRYYKNVEDSASIQLTPCTKLNQAHSKNNINHYQNQEVPKKALVATVRSTRARGRCHQGPVRQILADSSLCPAHCHVPPIRKTFFGGSVIISDVEDADDTEENEEGNGIHSTPTRIPLIWKETRSCSYDTCNGNFTDKTPSVPVAIVFLIFGAYVCIGAAILVTTRDWTFVDAAHFCFLALTTICVEDKLPHTSTWEEQIHLLACCVYLFIGLVILAMCFSLIQDEIAKKFKQFVNNIGYSK